MAAAFNIGDLVIYNRDPMVVVAVVIHRAGRGWRGRQNFYFTYNLAPMTSDILKKITWGDINPSDLAPTNQNVRENQLQSATRMGRPGRHRTVGRDGAVAAARMAAGLAPEEEEEVGGASTATSSAAARFSAAAAAAGGGGGGAATSGRRRTAVATAVATLVKEDLRGFVTSVVPASGSQHGSYVMLSLQPPGLERRDIPRDVPPRLLFETAAALGGFNHLNPNGTALQKNQSGCHIHLESTGWKKPGARSYGRNFELTLRGQEDPKSHIYAFQIHIKTGDVGEQPAHLAGKYRMVSIAAQDQAEAADKERRQQKKGGGGGGGGGGDDDDAEHLALMVVYGKELYNLIRMILRRGARSIAKANQSGGGRKTRRRKRKTRRRKRRKTRRRRRRKRHYTRRRKKHSRRRRTRRR